MTFEADLKTHLQADAGIVAAVADRIHPLKLPQGVTKPAITYHRVTGIPQTDLDGDDGDLIEVRAQIDCWGAGHDTVRALSELVRLRLQTAASTFKAICNFDQDFYEDDTRLYRVMLDCSFWYRTT